MDKPIQLKTFGSKITVPEHLEESIRRMIEADNRKFNAWIARLMDYTLEDDHASRHR